MNIPTLKWKDIGMEFVGWLPQNSYQNDTIWVIVDRLTKYSLCPSSLIEVPNSLPIFGGLFKKVSTQVKLSTALHPQAEGHEECTTQTIEDMVRCCVIDITGNWYNHFHES